MRGSPPITNSVSPMGAGEPRRRRRRRREWVYYQPIALGVTRDSCQEMFDTPRTVFINHLLLLGMRCPYRTYRLSMFSPNLVSWHRAGVPAALASGLVSWAASTKPIHRGGKHRHRHFARCFSLFLTPLHHVNLFGLHYHQLSWRPHIAPFSWPIEL